MAPLSGSVSSDQGSVASTLQDREQFQELLKTNLARAQNKMKIDADSNRSPWQFQLGEQVLLKLQPYVQSSVAHRPCPKLSFKYFGPYIVVDKIGDSAYKLQLLAGSQVHPVFHVFQLKPFTPNYAPVFSELPFVPLLDLHDLEPETILDRRLSKRGNQTIT
jgi:hypothetical protein